MNRYGKNERSKAYHSQACMIDSLSPFHERRETICYIFATKMYALSISIYYIVHMHIRYIFFATRSRTHTRCQVKRENFAHRFYCSGQKSTFAFDILVLLFSDTFLPSGDFYAVDNKRDGDKLNGDVSKTACDNYS